MAIAVIGSWVVIGVIIGFIASKIVPTSGDDPGMGIGITAAGALAVAAVYSWIKGAGPTAFSLPILIGAATGGVAATIIWHVVRSRFGTQEKYVPRRSY